MNALERCRAYAGAAPGSQPPTHADLSKLLAVVEAADALMDAPGNTMEELSAIEQLGDALAALTEDTE